MASVNGVALCSPEEPLSVQALRQHACTELLRQAAVEAGLLDAGDPPAADCILSEAASAAIEALLERELHVPEPSDAECTRHHAANAERYRTNERCQVRHILFAVTPGTDVTALRQRAEACLIDVRCRDRDDADIFGRSAQLLSNCPSGERGGDLGWLTAQDCAPEFGRELFGRKEVGVLSRLVHSRFGLHVVEVLQREAGAPQPYESVRDAVALALHRQAYATALRQYLRVLAGRACIEGVDLDGVPVPLVQ